MEGCLIVALGTPRALTEQAIREFLGEFLSDPRVVDFPRALWNPILNGIVLRTRPASVKEQYEHVWLHDGERTGSPLLVHTLNELDHLRAALPDVDVDYAVTYTTPSIRERLDAMVARGVTGITVIPLYPHYAPSTVQPIIDQVDVYKGQRGKLPPIHVVRSYETQPTMVRWYAQRIAEVLADAEASGSPVQRLVLSYHGVPERQAHGPEDYQAECEATTRAITAELERLAEFNEVAERETQVFRDAEADGLPESGAVQDAHNSQERDGSWGPDTRSGDAAPDAQAMRTGGNAPTSQLWRVPTVINTYQSKFGPGKWLSPATIKTMAVLPSEGVQSIAVATPGFFADCIETTYELDVLNQEEFVKAGGERYVRVAPINSDAVAGQILAEVYRAAQG